MTVVLAVACAEGVVMASDTQATEGGDNTRFQVPKIFELSDRAVWAGSGHVGIIQDLRTRYGLERNRFNTAISVDSPLRSIAKSVFDPHYKDYVETPAGVPPINPGAIVLAAGVGRDDKPWIWEVSQNCTTCSYSERGFHAIGSGSAMAQMANALTSHFDLLGKPLPFAELVAYRTIDAVIETSAYGVGGPIDLWVVTAAGCAQRSESELKAIRDQVNVWRETERETLEELMSGAGATEPPADMPAPVEPKQITLSAPEPVAGSDQ